MNSCPLPWQIHQDLHWCLHTTPMEGTIPVPAQAVTEALVARVQRIWASRTSHRLGHYYEMLWQALLEADHRYQVILTDHQLSAAGQTLGALDFLLWDQQQQTYLHLEVAAKFYLQAGDANNLYCWRGPNASDSLGRKLNHMREHQSQLVYHPQAREQLNQILSERGLTGLHDDNLRTGLLIQGWRFTHLHQRDEQDTGQTDEAVWLHFSDLHQLPAGWGEGALWAPKFTWLSGPRTPPAPAENDSQPVTINRTDSQLQLTRSGQALAHSRAAMLVFNRGTRHRRLMLVPDQWPARDQADFCALPSRRM